MRALPLERGAGMPFSVKTGQVWLGRKLQWDSRCKLPWRTKASRPDFEGARHSAAPGAAIVSCYALFNLSSVSLPTTDDAPTACSASGSPPLGHSTIFHVRPRSIQPAPVHIELFSIRIPTILLKTCHEFYGPSSLNVGTSVHDDACYLGNALDVYPILLRRERLMVVIVEVVEE
ncbi:hypothetical protein B0T09DRAFT_67415 [Sordaria sp. MPI-SDFR-AT-0083]|nr:hypothetical protein B0T09DRAFT_67415 [Sordaria sp. MPI-SDFR-AT-0083]